MNPETRLCPVVISAKRQQEHSCEKGTAECAWSRDLSRPYRAEKAFISASPCGKGIVFQFCLHCHSCSLPREQQEHLPKLGKPLCQTQRAVGLVAFWKGKLCTIGPWTQRTRWQVGSWKQAAFIDAFWRQLWFPTTLQSVLWDAQAWFRVWSQKRGQTDLWTEQSLLPTCNNSEQELSTQLVLNSYRCTQVESGLMLNLPLESETHWQFFPALFSWFLFWIRYQG